MSAWRIMTGQQLVNLVQIVGPIEPNRTVTLIVMNSTGTSTKQHHDQSTIVKSLTELHAAFDRVLIHARRSGE